jgi:PAS domain S-box-containing protein
VSTKRSPAGKGPKKVPDKAVISGASPDDRETSVSADASPIGAGAGNIVAAVGAFGDMTRLKGTQTPLQQANEILEGRIEERTRKLTEANRKLKKTIRERIAAERSLSRQTRIFEAFFASTVTPLALLDRTFNYIRVNEAYAKTCKLNVPEFSGRNHFEFYPSEAEVIFEKVVRTKDAYRAPDDPLLFAQDPHRRETYWNWSLTPLLDDSGEVEFLFLSLEEVTERRRAALALKGSEQLLRGVLEALPVGVWITDKQGVIVSGNRTGQELWADAGHVGVDGYGEHKGWRLDTGEQIGPGEWAASRAIRKGETSLNEEVLIECFDGTHKAILNSALPIKDDNGEITGAIIVNQDITKRMETQEALRSANAYNRSLIEISLDPLVTISPDGKIDDVNTATEVVTGLSRDALIGTDFSDYFTDPAKARAGYKLVFDQGFVRDYELEIRHKDGGLTPVLYNASVYRDERGKVRGVFAAARDISKREQARKELRESEERYRSLFMGMAEGMVLQDIDGTIVTCNPSAEQILGFSAHLIIGTTSIENQWQAVKEDGSPFPGEMHPSMVTLRTGQPYRNVVMGIRRPDHRMAWISVNSQPLFRAGETRPYAVVTTFFDITESRRAEEELVRLGTAVEQSAEGIAITDLRGRVVYANPAFLLQTGYTQSEIVGQNIGMVRSGRDDSEIYKDVWSTIKNCKPWSGHVTGRQKDGALYDVDLRISPVRDASGRIVNCVLVASDITEKKRMEKQLHESQRMEAIGTLAGGIAHDFNNIIAGIIGFTEMVLEDVPPESALNRRLQLVLKAANRGRDLVRQILTFSRRREVEKRPVSMGLIIDEVSSLIRASLPSTIEIRHNISVESDVVLADQTQIHQVIINLCSNAAHAMRDGGGVLGLSLTDETLTGEEHGINSAVTGGRFLKLTVSDTGCGMAPEVVGRIFDPFFTTKAAGEGTGLGLSVVHGIVKNHDGAIGVYSTPGQGSSFHVFLPKLGLETERGPETVTETEAAIDIPRGGASILVVDDEPMLVEVSTHRLIRLGYRVTGKTSSLEALEVFRAQPGAFDLVLTDYIMPQMTGLDLARELLRIRPDIPVIMCSGLSDPVPMEMIQAVGVREFFSKPIGKDDFARIVGHVLDQRGSAKSGKES